MIRGTTTLIAHLGYPTATFKAPMIYNPYFEKEGIDAIVMPMGIKPEVFPEVFASLQREWAEDSIAATADISEPLPFAARLHRLWLTQPNYTLAELHTIECPTLVAVGDHDLPQPEHTLELVRAIPGAQLCVIPGATHAVLYERADLADEIVLQFLKTPIRPAGGRPQM